MAPQIEALWPFGQVAVADHRHDDDMAAIAARILKDAPPRFALAGLSMGGYIAFAMLRQAPERIAKLALLDTSARADTPEQITGRKTQIAMAQSGRYGEIPDLAIPRYLNAKHQRDERLTGDRAADDRRNRTEGLCAPVAGDHVAAGFAPDAGLDPLPDARRWSAMPTSRRRRSSTRRSQTAFRVPSS